MFKFIFNIRQSFLALYTFLDPIYIIFMALPYIAAAVYYYLVLVTGPFILTALTPYLETIYTILDFSESCLRTALKI